MTRPPVAPSPLDPRPSPGPEPHQTSTDTPPPSPRTAGDLRRMLVETRAAVDEAGHGLAVWRGAALALACLALTLAGALWRVTHRPPPPCPATAPSNAPTGRGGPAPGAPPDGPR